MANYQPLMSVQEGGRGVDPGRTKACLPGYLVHSAQMNEDKLICYMRACCFCCSAEDVARRTFVDVYSNGVLVNVPKACCCCIWSDDAKFIYFDQFRLGEPIDVGCCSPCPYPCPHACGCCGETLGFKKCCGCPTGVGHWSCTGGLLLAPFLCVFALCICPLDVIAGFEDGQAAILVDQIKRARARFEAAGNQNPPMAVAPPMMGGPMGGQPMMGGQPPMMQKQAAPGPPGV